jgi:hypothetical protein
VVEDLKKVVQLDATCKRVAPLAVTMAGNSNTPADLEEGKPIPFYVTGKLDSPISGTNIHLPSVQPRHRAATSHSVPLFNYMTQLIVCSLHPLKEEEMFGLLHGPKNTTIYIL